MEICVLCEKKGEVAYYNPKKQNEIVCIECAFGEKVSQKETFLCEEVREVKARAKKVKRVQRKYCKAGYLSEYRVCSGCGEIKKIVNKGKELCRKCYRSEERFQKKCSGCGKIAPVAKKIKKTGEVLCRSCYVQHHSSKKECFVCKRKRLPASRLENGKTICNSCYVVDPSRYEKCFYCGVKRRVATRTPNGEPICQKCYSDDESRHEHCFICGIKKVVATRNANGNAMCSWCSRKKIE